MPRFDSLSLKIRLPMIISGVALTMALVVGFVGYKDIASIARRNMDAQMNAILVERKSAVEAFYTHVADNLTDMSNNPTTAAGLQGLQPGWEQAGRDPASNLTSVDIDNNPKAEESRMVLDTRSDPIRYNDQYATFNLAFRDWVQLRGFDDLLLIDLDGNIVYSMANDAGFVSNLNTGSERDDLLATVFKAALADASRPYFSDFAEDPRSKNASSAFGARAILGADGAVAGVIAVRMTEVALSAVVNNPSNLGQTGQAILVGPDQAARSLPRFDGQFKFLENLPNATDLRGAMVDDEGVQRGVALVSGDTGSAMSAKLDIPDLDYTIRVELSDKEGIAQVNEMLLDLALWTAISWALVMALSVLIVRNVTNPVNRLVGSVKSIADGNLEAEVGDIDRSDELGDIARSLDALRQKLSVGSSAEAERDRQAEVQHVVVDGLTLGLTKLSDGNLAQSIDVDFGTEHDHLRVSFNHTMEKLNETITMVVDTSESIRSRSREMSQSSEDLSRRTENQAATLEQTAAALDELTASIRTAADSAKEVEAIVRSARSEAEESGKVVQGAVLAMTEIENSSDQISQIIGVIDDIAFQTNLLALNAGVEAARAGDAGKGFAVVASEVRALAQRSSAAAREIKTLISASTQNVGRGVEQVGRAGTALENIVNRVSHISTLVSSIATAAAEQSTGLAEINLGVTQLDQVTQQNAAMVEESTAASQSLNQEAAGLADLVSQFTIRKRRSETPVAAFAPVDSAFESDLSQAAALPEPLPPRPAKVTTLQVAAGSWQDF